MSTLNTRFPGSGLAPADVPATPFFRPEIPDRPSSWAPLPRVLFGDMTRNALLGWPKKAFEETYVTRRLMGIRVHVINEPDAVKRVLEDNFENYPPHPMIAKLLGSLLGEGLGVISGPAWQDQRQHLQPAFEHNVAIDAADFIHTYARERLSDWLRAPGPEIDISAEASNVADIALGRMLHGNASELSSPRARDHLKAFLRAAAQPRLGAAIGAPWLDRSAVIRDGEQARSFLRAQLTALIEARRDQDTAADFLGRAYSAFVAAHSPDVAVRRTCDNALGLLLSGQETVANLIVWVLYLLSHDPMVQTRARAEIRAATKGTGPPPSSSTPYLTQIIKETLRLFPPVARIDRVALAEDELCGHKIHKGDMVSVWPWLLHRNKALWEVADCFDPDNFSAERCSVHSYQYIPFGGPPRGCPGSNFAVMVARTVLAEWIANVEFRPVHSVQPLADYALRPSKNLSLAVLAAPRRTDLLPDS